MENKVCSVCKISKPLESFSFKYKALEIRSKNCKDCQKNYYRNHYDNNTQYYVNRSKKIKKDIKIKFFQYKLTLKCSRCIENDPRCLDFHHRKPEEKFMAVSLLVNRGATWKRIMLEVEKCDVLCSNCHRKEDLIYGSWLNR